MQPINPDMVQTIHIDNECLESFPCQHHCKIVLMDGRKAFPTLGGPDVNSLIQEIAKEKISCGFSDDHFKITDQMKKMGWKQEPASQILTEVFKVETENPSLEEVEITGFDIVSYTTDQQ